MLQNVPPLRQPWNEDSRYRDAEGAEHFSPSACQFRLVSRFACCEPLSLPKTRYSLNVDQNLQTVHFFLEKPVFFSFFLSNSRKIWEKCAKMRKRRPSSNEDERISRV